METTSQQRAEDARQQQLENYQILRTIALNGDLEAFAALNGLDFERNQPDFDATIAREGKIWLQRNGAL